MLLHVPNILAPPLLVAQLLLLDKWLLPLLDAVVQVAAVVQRERFDGGHFVEDSAGK